MTTQTLEFVTDAELQAVSGGGLVDWITSALPNPVQDFKDVIAAGKSGDGKQTAAAMSRFISSGLAPVGPMAKFSSYMEAGLNH